MTTEQVLNLLQLGLDHPGEPQNLTEALHDLETAHGLPPREPVTLQECLYELSRRMSGLEVTPEDYTKL